VIWLEGQALISAGFLILVGIPMWRRINWVGDLKDAISEYPELNVYTVATTLWWLEFFWTIYGVWQAAMASACSRGLKYAGHTLAGYMFGLGLWLDLIFHVVVPAYLHLYSGQAAAEVLPPGAMFEEPADSLPPAPPKRKRPPPKRECPRCKHDKIADELKMCPICGQFVPPLEYFQQKEKELQEEDKANREKEIEYHQKKMNVLG